MQERWLPISEFPGYSVSNMGNVFNDEAEHPIVVSLNQFGIPHVGLTKNGIQYRRGLAHLVAKTFIRNPNERFDTPINMNGDRTDCRVDNLAWRSRWFAIHFFREMATNMQLIDEPIVDSEGRHYKGSRHAAEYLGVLESDIFKSLEEGRPVPPMFIQFQYVR